MSSAQIPPTRFALGTRAQRSAGGPSLVFWPAHSCRKAQKKTLPICRRPERSRRRSDMRKATHPYCSLARPFEDWHSSDYRRKAFVKALRLRLRAGLRQCGEESFLRYPGLSRSAAHCARRSVTHLGYPYTTPLGLEYRCVKSLVNLVCP